MVSCIIGGGGGLQQWKWCTTLVKLRHSHEHDLGTMEMLEVRDVG